MVKLSGHVNIIFDMFFVKMCNFCLSSFHYVLINLTEFIILQALRKINFNWIYSRNPMNINLEEVVTVIFYNYKEYHIIGWELTVEIYNVIFL